MDVKQLLVRLRSTIEEARSMPMSSSAVINRNDVLGLIGELDEAVAAVGHDAVRVDAEAQAELLMEQASVERDRLVSDSDVHRIARDEAEELRADVERECEELRRETDEYVDSRLANLEITLNKTLDAVTRGRDRLQGRSQLDQQSLDSLASRDDSGIPPLPQH